MNPSSYLMAALLSILCTMPCLAQSAGAGDSDRTQSDVKLIVQSIIQNGLKLEAARDWIAAMRHYETGVRSYPNDQELRRRLLISRLHYDVLRRGSDASIQRLSSVGKGEAIELYSEVLSRLEMSYVDVINLAEIVRGGTAYLEIALTEPKFLKQHLPNRSKSEIERFRTSIHRLTLRDQIANRFEARNIVLEAAASAERQIGLKQSTTILQFALGAIGLLDPYSSFLSRSELEEVESQIEGNFVGLGIALKPHSVPLEILNVIPGGPAEQAGIQSGDKIAEIGTVRCLDVGAERAADLLRGPENSHVRLLIEQATGSRSDLVVVRRRVEVPSVEEAKILDAVKGIAYLKISSFQKTTVEELDRALWDLQRRGMSSLIIDVRGNPGGWLDASIEVADRFLSSGRIVSTRGKNGIENQNYDATRSGTWSMPLTLLIDQESASASEILAGAIRDNHRGEVIGQTTFGKGSVQGLYHTKTLSSGIRLTVSKFYSPNGRAISEQGVQPTLAVEEEDPVYFVAKPNLDSGDRKSAKKTDRVLDVALRRAASGAMAAKPQFSRN
ncbi:MAG: S41 family peptidase [Planctomycetota bacterium]